MYRVNHDQNDGRQGRLTILARCALVPAAGAVQRLFCVSALMSPVESRCIVVHVRYGCPLLDYRLRFLQRLLPCMHTPAVDRCHLLQSVLGCVLVDRCECVFDSGR